MIGSWEMSSLSEPKRYFENSIAYIQASLDICNSMISDKNRGTWPNANVALMLAAHSVELFLKGAILLKSNKAWGHTLEELNSIYHDIYTEKEYRFNCPFKTEYLEIPEEKQKELKKKEPQQSILFRYPVKEPGVEWNGIFGFIPNEFIDILNDLNADYDELISKYENN
jgi:HEPN domain-containing protein